VLDLLSDVTHGGAWSSQDLITLIGWYYLYICEPTLYPLKHMKWGTKSNKAVLRMLDRIRKSGCADLKKHFPENPNEWTATDDAALDQQLKVRPERVQERVTDEERPARGVQKRVANEERAANQFSCAIHNTLP